MLLRLGFFYVVVYGSSNGSILWVLGIGCYGFGSSGELFLGFYLWVLGELKVEVSVVMVLVLRGWCMIRKWKWSLLTKR